MSTPNPQDVALDAMCKQAMLHEPYYAQMELLKEAGQLAPETLFLYEREKEAFVKGKTGNFFDNGGSGGCCCDDLWFFDGGFFEAFDAF